MVAHNAKDNLKPKDFRAILKPRMFKFRENQMCEIQEVPVLLSKLPSKFAKIKGKNFNSN